MSSPYAAVLDSLRVLDRTAKVCVAITAIPVLLRMWTRAWILRKFQWDDWAMLLSWLCFNAVCGVLIAVVKSVFFLVNGRPQSFTELKAFILAGKILYIFTMVFLKVSLSAFFLRIFTVQRLQRYIIFTVGTITILYSIVCIVVTGATVCGSTSGFSVTTDTRCPDGQFYEGISISWSVMNAVGDVVYSILAVDAIRRIRMRPKTKACAIVIICFGSIGGVASIVRVAILTTIGRISESGGALSVTWTILEMSIGLMATNLACLRPLLRLLRRKFRCKGQGSSDDPSTGQNQAVTSYPRVNPTTEASGSGQHPEIITLTSALDGKAIYPLKDWTEADPERQAGTVVHEDALPRKT